MDMPDCATEVSSFIQRLLQHMQETDRIMEEMYTVLEQHQTVGWLELVMNHKDFSQTVENIFTLSFLVGGPCLTKRCIQPWPDCIGNEQAGHSFCCRKVL